MCQHIPKVAAAARDESLKVVTSLRALQPAYRDLNVFVVDAVANSKRSVSDIIFEFHTQVADSKEQYLRSAIQNETKILQKIGSSSMSDESCLSLLRTKVDLDVLLAGIKFSTCIVEIDDQLNEQIAKVYGELDGSSGSPTKNSIYQAFRGLNIFQDPQAIDIKLQEKLEELKKLPTELTDTFQGYVKDFRSQLVPIVAKYKGCLKANDDLLSEAFGITSKQLSVLCEGK